MNSREFLTRLWNLDNDERPGFLIGYTGPRLKRGNYDEFLMRGTARLNARALVREKIDNVPVKWSCA